MKPFFDADCRSDRAQLYADREPIPFEPTRSPDSEISNPQWRSASSRVLSARPSPWLALGTAVSLWFPLRAPSLDFPGLTPISRPPANFSFRDSATSIREANALYWATSSRRRWERNSVVAFLRAAARRLSSPFLHHIRVHSWSHFFPKYLI